MDILNDTVRRHIFHTEQTSVDTCLSVCVCVCVCVCNPVPSILLLFTSYSNSTSGACHPSLLVEIFFFTFLSLLLLSPHTLMVCAVWPDLCKDRATLMGLLFTSVGTKILPNENICLCSSHAQLSPKRNVLINFFFKS